MVKETMELCAWRLLLLFKKKSFCGGINLELVEKEVRRKLIH